MFPSFDFNCGRVAGRLAVNQAGQGAEIGHCILGLGLSGLSGQKRRVKYTNLSSVLSSRERGKREGRERVERERRERAGGGGRGGGGRSSDARSTVNVLKLT